MVFLRSKSYSNLIFGFIISVFSMSAQDVTTIKAANEDISDNFDLEAVASIFGESKDLEDFEKRLNDPKTQISNLDLNNDGEVDYLRVMESGDNNVHTISIQSIIGKDQYQEVATIDVKKDTNGTTQVQVVGNVDMYGPNYYITPVYPVVPVFFTFFWVASYHHWNSPWYWGHHPPYFSPWRPYPHHTYRSNVHVNVNVHNSYNRTDVRINNSRPSTRDNAYFKNNPDKTFNKRNPNVSNRDQLTKNRKTSPKNKGVNTDRGYKSTGKPARNPNNRASTKPSTRPSNKPSTKPSTRPSAKPKPSTRPSTPTRPNTRPSAQPRPSTRPSSSYSRRPPSRSSYRRTRH